MGSQEANRREEKEARRVEQKLAQAEAQWKVTEQRAIAAEADADGLRAQLQEQEAAIRSAQEAATQRKRAIAAEAEVAELRAQLQAQKTAISSAQEAAASVQKAAAQHQDEVKWRDARIIELAEKVEAAAKKEATPKDVNVGQDRRQGRLVSMWDPTRMFKFWQNDVTGQRFADTGRFGVHAWQQETNRMGTPL